MPDICRRFLSAIFHLLDAYGADRFCSSCFLRSAQSESGVVVNSRQNPKPRSAGANGERLEREAGEEYATEP